MKTLCIVPFTSKEFPLLPHLMSSYDNVIFLSPKGIGTDKEDIAMMQNLEPLGFKFCNSIKGSIEIADDVLVSNINVEDVALYNFAYDALECAVKKGKKVMSFLQMHSYQKELLKKRSKINIDFYDNYEDNVELESAICYKERKNKLYEFKIPVLYVSELIPDSNGYSVFLNLISMFKKDKIEVLAISSDTYNVLINQTVLKFEKRNNFPDAIYQINNYIHFLTLQKNPDVILIKLPQPMIKYDNDNCFDFGMSAYMLSQAIPGDGNICCSYLGTPILQFWGNLNDSCKYKFGYPILGVFVNNKRIDMMQEKRISTFCVPNSSEYRIQELKLLNENNSLTFYDANNAIDFKRFYTFVIRNFFDIKFGVI